MWTQSPYNGKMHCFFLISQKPKQSQLSSHLDFVVNNHDSQYYDWGETFEQGT